MITVIGRLLFCGDCVVDKGSDFSRAGLLKKASGGNGYFSPGRLFWKELTMTLNHGMAVKFNLKVNYVSNNVSAFKYFHFI